MLQRCHWRHGTTRCEAVEICVLSQVISASSCERNRSYQRHIQTKISNKLSPETTEKLVYCQRCWPAQNHKCLLGIIPSNLGLRIAEPPNSRIVRAHILLNRRVARHVRAIWRDSTNPASGVARLVRWGIHVICTVIKILTLGTGPGDMLTSWEWGWNILLRVDSTGNLMPHDYKIHRIGTFIKIGTLGTEPGDVHVLLEESRLGTKKG